MASHDIKNDRSQKVHSKVAASVSHLKMVEKYKNGNIGLIRYTSGDMDHLSDSLRAILEPPLDVSKWHFDNW